MTENGEFKGRTEATIEGISDRLERNNLWLRTIDEKVDNLTIDVAKIKTFSGMVSAGVSIVFTVVVTTILGWIRR